jgi:hypothetical protein
MVSKGGQGRVESREGWEQGLLGVGGGDGEEVAQWPRRFGGTVGRWLPLEVV